VAIFHPASAGMDLVLGAIAYGAAEVCVLAPGLASTAYVVALREQMSFAQAILQGLGYEGVRLRVLEDNVASGLEQQLWSCGPAAGVRAAATFELAADKRTSLDLAIAHLARHAPAPKELLPLPAGAPFGTLAVNGEACTLCKACIGACPESALQDSPEAPALRFIERNCVQCGLCATTCPESAIRLVPRLHLGEAARSAVTLNEAEPFNCVSCARPFGTRRLIERMTGRLTGHSMFAGAALRRLQMCADCRVVDMMGARDEPSIFDFPGRQ
jgi:ferredoxin